MSRRCLQLIVFTIIFTSISSVTAYAAERDDINQTVDIPGKNGQGTEKRLNMIEFALISQSPEEVAGTWAKGAASRNGALQYAVLSDDLRDKYKADYEAWDWVTGASSPWIDSYNISAGEQRNDGTWKFRIVFHYTDSTKTSFFRTLNILIGTKIVEKPPLPVVYPGTGQGWCIVGFENENS